MAALGHDLTSTTSDYSWNSSHTSCTATRACGRSGCSYVLTETKSATKRISTAATCTAQEKYDYYIPSWTNSTYFGTTYCPNWHYSSALGHSYGTPSYSWNSTCTSCTASATCTRSGCTYVLTETKSATKTNTTAATCTADGKYDYTVSGWTNSSVFETDRCPCWHTIAALGHNPVCICAESSTDWANTFCEYRCSRCGEETSYSHKYVVVSMKAHTGFIGIGGNKHTGSYRCSYCGWTRSVEKAKCYDLNDDKDCDACGQGVSKGYNSDSVVQMGYE